MQTQETLPEKSSILSDPTDAQIDVAQDNLAKALEAYGEEGEAGLQKVLDRIYPETVRLETHKLMSGSHGVRVGKKLPSQPYRAQKT